VVRSVYGRRKGKKLEIGNRLEVGNNRREEKLCKHEKLWSMGNYGSRFEVNGIIMRKAGK
jgi:hypothetical protein